jgi:hypothetical protein
MKMLPHFEPAEGVPRSLPLSVAAFSRQRHGIAAIAARYAQIRQSHAITFDLQMSRLRQR